MENEEVIKNRANNFARQNKKIIARDLTDINKYPSEQNPISIFMAGSPGAGKTEYSKNLINFFQENNAHKIVRIEGDKFREYFEEYTGNNSHLFQGAISVLVNKIHDRVLDNKQSFLMDSTLSNYKIAEGNINRSLEKGRQVLIFYVYQKPEIAWKFTQAREVVEGRNIPKEVFINHFINSRDTVIKLLEQFKDRISVFLVIKNFETHNVENVLNLNNEKQKIDEYLDRRYNLEELNTLL